MPARVVSEEQIWEVTDGHPKADVVYREACRQKQSSQRVTSWRRLNQGRSGGHEPWRPVRCATYSRGLATRSGDWRS